MILPISLTAPTHPDLEHDAGDTDAEPDDHAMTSSPSTPSDSSTTPSAGGCRVPRTARRRRRQRSPDHEQPKDDVAQTMSKGSAAGAERKRSIRRIILISPFMKRC